MTPDTYIASGILELYVAGVLPEEERVKVEALAANNVNVQEEIKRIEATVAGYTQLHNPGFDADSVYEKIQQRLDQPPPQAVEPQTAVSAAKTRVKQKPPEKPVAVIALEENIEKPEIKKQLGETPRRSFAGAFAFTLLLLVMSVLGNFYLYNDWLETREAYNELHSKNIMLTEQVNKTEKLQQQAFSDMGIYANPAYKIFTLNAADQTQNAQVRVFYNNRTKQVMAKPMELAKAPQGKAYQLWAVDNEGKAVDAGLLKIVSDSAGMQSMKEVASATKFAVTIEPETGSAQPTTQPVFVSAGN